LKIKEIEFSERYGELGKNRESYIAASEKLEKYRKLQEKSILKIENGDLHEL
jgi:hypothetical protein